MTLLTRLERSFGWIAIGNLPLYIVTAQALIYVWAMLNPDQAHQLVLDPYMVRYHHEYWRLLTFIFITPIQNVIFAFFYLYLLFVYGEALENEWGSFPFTLFYLVGVLGTMVAAFLFGSWNGAFFLNTSIFLAFAARHPEFQLLLFFVLPVKIKWLAALTWVWLGYKLVTSPMSTRAAIVISLVNYFVFFGKAHFDQIRDMIGRYRHRQRFKEWR